MMELSKASLWRFFFLCLKEEGLIWRALKEVYAVEDRARIEDGREKDSIRKVKIWAEPVGQGSVSINL